MPIKLIEIEIKIEIKNYYIYIFISFVVQLAVEGVH